MTLSSATQATRVEVQHRGWMTPASSPRLSNDPSVAPLGSIRLTNRAVIRNGIPGVPVSGELHYSRVPRRRWRRRLEQMKAGGITAVSTYVIWIHHQPTPGAADFSGNLDVAAFIREAHDVGLDFVLRIGPWVHGEVRNGGLPDWVQKSGATVRSNDPAYLEQVSRWFAALGQEVGDLCRQGDVVTAIQLDNELYDQPDHLRTLKELALEAGLLAPVYTATGWGSAQLPAGELLPLFGGYADGFWVATDAPWEESFREHFFFSHRWDDPGIGADLRTTAAAQFNPAEPQVSGFPAATCELGGGMATAYHRRPVLSGLDVAAVAHNKIGNGSAWQGYYMFAGGANPAGRPGLQESHETGYPNDMPTWDYDFGAPIGTSGSLGDGYKHLKRQHLFLQAFGETLAATTSSLPAVSPSDVHDSETLRWALRSDGTSGFVIISWHQPHEPLEDHPPVQFQVQLDERELVFPQDPVRIPAGTLAHWPVGLKIGGVTVDWATASPLTVLPGEEPTLVLTAEKSIPVSLQFAEGTAIEAVSNSALSIEGTLARLDDGSEPIVVAAHSGESTLRILVLPYEAGLAAYSHDAPHRRLFISDDPTWVGSNGLIAGESLGQPSVLEYEPASGQFYAVDLAALGPEGETARGSAELSVRLLSPSSTVPESYGEFDERASAPSDADFARAAVYGVDLGTGTIAAGARRELVVEWEGDAARLAVDGLFVADRFWDGTPWRIDVDSLDITPGSRIEVHVLPLDPVAHVHLPADAEARRRAEGTQLCDFTRAYVNTWTEWTERHDS